MASFKVSMVDGKSIRLDNITTIELSEDGKTMDFFVQKEKVESYPKEDIDTIEIINHI